MADKGEVKKQRIKYYEDNMTKLHHIVAYLIYAIVISAVFYIYYHLPIFSVVGGLVVAIFQERNYAASVARKRANQLMVQFKDFLEIISISVSGGAGRSLENAIVDSVNDLEAIYNDKTDIVREIKLIVSDYTTASIPMVQGFMELAERSEVEDIKSFATIYNTIEGKTSDYGFIISQTHDIIKDKVEIKMEIETSMQSAKTEAYMMLVLPLVVIVVMSAMGSDLMNGLYEGIGRIAATFGLLCTLASYVLATRATEIKV